MRTGRQAAPAGTVRTVLAFTCRPFIAEHHARFFLTSVQRQPVGAARQDCRHLFAARRVQRRRVDLGVHRVSRA
ncbi:hypothetical protein CA830_36095, partial [Burkholderia multivorans]